MTKEENLQRSLDKNSIQHFEMKKGEIYIGNFSTKDFNTVVGFKQKRLGKIPLDVKGNFIKHTTDFFPCFVSKQEFIDKINKNYDEWGHLLTKGEKK